jgi:hypothetical protein
MWIGRGVYEHLVEEARGSRAVIAQLEAQLDAAWATNDALRASLRALQDNTEADRAALRDAAQSLHAHLQADASEAGKLAETAIASAARQVVAEQRKVAALHERVAVADVNFGWCRQLVNMMQAERAALLNQRGIIVPTMSLSGGMPPMGPPVDGAGTPGVFEDADQLANAIGVSFDDMGDEAAAKQKVSAPDDVFL